MVYFGQYLKDYLESNNISQTEFALRLGITQKHMSEILNGKTNITLEMAANIERLTKIPSSFIISIERDRILYEDMIKEYIDENNLKKILKDKWCLNELIKRNWVYFKDEKSTFQNYIDILDFLRVRDFKAQEKISENVLFKKNGEDYYKLALWIARCDKLVEEQKVGKYDSSKLIELVDRLKEYSFENGYDINVIQRILNEYGIYFVCEKALSGTKVRGCFKVRNTVPAIYITANYSSKDSLYFELFHEIGHCKSDYTIAKNKVIADGDEMREKRADEFALDVMIPNDIVEKIIDRYDEDYLLRISEENEISMSFLVGRLAKLGLIEYGSKMYNKYKNI